MKFFTSLTVAGAGLAGFTATALAANSVDPPAGQESLFDLAKPVLDAVMHGQGWLAAALALVLCVALTKRYLAPKVEWLHSDPAGFALVLLGAFGGATATALMAGSPMSAALALTALKIALTAAGGYTGLKKFLLPLLGKLKSKLPGWAALPIDGLLFALGWLLGDGKREAAAKKAGDAAVEKNPARGLESITGTPREVK